MTDNQTPDSPPPDRNRDGRKSLVISPLAAALALALICAIAYNLHLDAASKDYDGLWVTGILAALIAGVLGFDLKFPGRGDR